MAQTAEEIANDRMRAFYEYSELVLKDASDNYEWLEDKATRYLTALGLLLAAAAVPIALPLGSPSHSVFQPAAALLSLLDILFIGVAAAFCFLAMKPSRGPRRKISLKTRHAYRNTSPDKLYEKFGVRVLDSASKLQKLNERRGQWVQVAFVTMMFAFGLAFAAAFVTWLSRLQ